MSLILCRQKAEIPFCHEKLNMRIWDEAELCYAIYNYPLLCMDDFLDKTLFLWLDNELGLKELSSKLSVALLNGDPKENSLIMILQECNYYNNTEIREFADRILELRKYTDYELLRLESKTLFKARNLRDAYERLEVAMKIIDELKRHAASEEEIDRLYKLKADYYIDMAVIMLNMFDERKAVELLKMSIEVFSTKRAESMLYLVTGEGNLTAGEKADLDVEREETLENVRKGDRYKNIEKLFNEEPTAVFKKAEKIISTLKNNFRKM